MPAFEKEEMNAIIDRDIIAHITSSGTGVEIGSVPKGVGLERLRWDGKEIVDLADLNAIWVSPDMTLHVIEVPGSTLIKMSYSDRKDLINNAGTIRLKTNKDIDAERQILKKNRLRAGIQKDIGDSQDLLADAFKIISLLVMALIGKDETAQKLLGDLAPDIKEMYPMTRLNSHLPGMIESLKEKMAAYYGKS